MGSVSRSRVSTPSSDAPARKFLHAVECRSIGELAEYYRDGYSRLTFARALPAAAAPVDAPGVTTQVVG